MDALMFWLLKRAPNGAWRQIQHAAIEDFFGHDKRVVGHIDEGVRKVIAFFLKHGSNVQTDKAVKALGIDRAWIQRLRTVWADEIELLVKEAQEIGYTRADLSMCVEFNTGQTFIRRLRTYRRWQEHELVSLTPGETATAIRFLWQEYKEAKAYGGAASDDFEVEPPMWFIRHELGLSVEGGKVLVRTWDGWQVVDLSQCRQK